MASHVTVTSVLVEDWDTVWVGELKLGVHVMAKDSPEPSPIARTVRIEMNKVL